MLAVRAPGKSNEEDADENGDAEDDLIDLRLAALLLFMRLLLGLRMH